MLIILLRGRRMPKCQHQAGLQDATARFRPAVQGVAETGDTPRSPIDYFVDTIDHGLKLGMTGAVQVRRAASHGDLVMLYALTPGEAVVSKK